MAQDPIGLARSQKGPGGLPHPMEMSPITKYDKNIVFQFWFLLAMFAYNSN